MDETQFAILKQSQQQYQQMFDQKITKFSDLPLEDKDRKNTDILCTIIGSLFAVAMLAVAIMSLSLDHYNQVNFPTDSDFVACSYGANKNYQFVYFPDIADINTRVCVSVCPSGDGSPLICRTNSKVPSCDLSRTYPSEVSFGRLGGFCAPLDKASQDQLIKTANLQHKWNFLNIYDCIRISLALAFGIGVCWLFLVQCLPRLLSAIATLLAILSLGALGVVVLLGNIAGVSLAVKYALGFVLIGFAILFTFFLCFYRLRNKLIGIFLDWSTRFIKEECCALSYIFVFILFTAGLICLCLFQHLAYLSRSEPQRQAGDIFLKLSPNIPLFILNLVQFIWGLQFLKDSFNFVISGLATQWYSQRDTTFFLTFKRLLSFHFGSIGGGSFLNAFFNIVNFLLQSVRCYRDGACPLFADCYESICGCNRNFFELVRTDVYSYINLTGIAYCNAARNCEYLIEHSALFVGCQSLLYFYRISAYCFTVGLTLLITYNFQLIKLAGNVDFISLIFSCVLSYCTLNYFVDMHANIAQGVQVSYLIEELLGGTKGKTGEVIGSDRFDFKHEIKALEKTYKDGKFC